ncbi:MULTISPECIES: DNA/RNA non-specific endonuclease [unclassified Streptomyces]|uniref:DNA/RNA non-specific endonuclease n=1 Tax=unclassified Streptomyces TaxID=2593676 RepID=UPI001BE5E2F5|nr:MULTISPECIES: DNA/RNA non-specific endonuclease [unclassified Streptomyces]MBT2403237.1 DNA/RNA non-specific endonuclease [Streptomyces sp. ISL-21]MBT2610387.1 DNA/RNA non-specific endonuclease [Streptomyces sp. ISL-87]
MARRGAVDAVNGNRTTGVDACLDRHFLINNQTEETSSERQFDPPGHVWAKGYMADFGNEPSRFWVNACHLLAKDLTGDAREENFATCSRQANAWTIDRRAPQMTPKMLTYESRVKKAVMGGQVVRYKVTPLYEGPRTVPYAFKMQASGWNPDGSPGIVIDDEVPNQFFGLRTGKWHNLGRVSNPGPVPVRGTDEWNNR